MKKVQIEELVSPVTSSTNKNIPTKADTQTQIKKLHEDIETALDEHQAENNNESLPHSEQPMTTEFTVKHKSAKNFLRRAAIVTGLFLGGLMGAEKTEAQKIKTYSDSLEYIHAQKRYEDSLDLYKNSTINIAKLTQQLGVAPKITKYDDPENAPFASVYAKNYKGVGFIGTERDKYFKYIISGADGNNYRGIDVTNETPSSLQKKFSAAKEKYQQALQQSSICSEDRHGSLVQTDLDIQNNTVKIKKTTLNYHFVQKYHGHILPDKQAEFFPRLDYSSLSKNKLTFDSNLIYETEHTRSADDNFYINEIKKPQKENTIFAIFGNNTADGQKFYEYGARETNSTDIEVYLYDKPKYKPVYVKPIQENAPIVPIKNIEKETIPQGQSKELEQTTEDKGDPVYLPNGNFMGYIKDGIFEAYWRSETVEGEADKFSRDLGAVDIYLRQRFGAYYKGMKKSGKK